MIYEYALDPKLLDNWQDIRYFKDQCGAENGRLISQYPSRWERAVFEAIRLSNRGTVEQHRMKEAVRHIVRHKFFRRPQMLWDDTLPWFDNARSEHQRMNFRSIISKGYGDDEPNCILAGEHVDDSKLLWKCSPSVTIKRDAETMVLAVAPVLQLSSQIIFIDPHFDPQAWRFRNPLVKFLEVLSSRGNGIPLQRLQYHVSDLLDENEFKSRVDAHLKPCLPAGMTLAFCRWKKADMHNRFILTNIGLIEFGIGLDEWEGQGSPREDQLKRLSDNDQAKFWAKYSTRMIFYSVSA